MADLQSCSPGSPSSYTRFLCKSFFFALCLFAIPLFPPQAPDFINQNLITQLWELLHLLFVGIAISYGLFCRRNVDARTDKFVDPQSCGSNMFQFSSIFEDGYDCYSWGSDEKNAYHNWSWKCSESSQLSEQGQIPGPINGKEDVIQAWNLQYFRGDSMVVVAQPNCKVDSIGWKPLGLPVRSLRSRIRKRDGAEALSGGGGTSDELRHEKDGNPVGENLDDKFSTSSCFAWDNQPIPWHPRSERVDSCSLPSHGRRVSVDQIQFESLKSRSLRSPVSFSSQASSVSDSQSRRSPSSSAGSQESPLRDMEGKGRSSRGSFPPTSLPKPTNPVQLIGKASLHSRHFSHGSLPEYRNKRGFEDELKEVWGRKNDAVGALDTEAKPACLTKSLSRGKSVRTFRAKRSNEVQGVYPGERGPSDDFFAGISYDVPRSTTLSGEHWIEKEERPEESSLESGEDKNLGQSSDEESVPEAVADAAKDDCHEVDKKAGEFIAKFRQQIKLQKMGSVETPRGSSASDSFF